MKTVGAEVVNVTNSPISTEDPCFEVAASASVRLASGAKMPAINPASARIVHICFQNFLDEKAIFIFSLFGIKITKFIRRILT
jgi:hypothetical protein